MVTSEGVWSVGAWSGGLFSTLRGVDLQSCGFPMARQTRGPRGPSDRDVWRSPVLTETTRNAHGRANGGGLVAASEM